MKLDYDLFFEKEVFLELERLARGRRHQAVALFDRISENPFFDIDLAFTDDKGRTVYKTLAGCLLVTFSVDHAVREVKILDLIEVVES